MADKTNTIYTYIEDISQASGLDKEVLELWKKTWRKNGWEPVVLTPADAKKHPRHNEFFNKVSRIRCPFNAPQYNLLCWMRWLAFDQVGGGIVSDYDTINMRLKPNDLIPTESVRICHANGVPCLLQATKEGSALIIEKIINHTPDYNLDKRNKGNWNDMLFFVGSDFEKNFNGRPCYLEFGSEWHETDGLHSWKELPVIHFSLHACRTNGHYTKVEAITKNVNL